MSSLSKIPVTGSATFPAEFTFGSADSSVNLDISVTRGDLVESTHRVHAAVVDAKGQLLATARNAHLVTWWRSCAKPFQVMPLLYSGHFDALGWGTDELALACASHGGEPEHVALAGSMLSRIGLEEGDLACGPHDPLTARGSMILRESGHPVTRLHNNCSGKHAAMLARAVAEQWTIEGYELRHHPVQLAAADTVRAWTSLAPDALATATDGCGVTVYGLPLAHMALSYARLCAAATAGDVLPSRIVHAMTDNSFLIGGTDRFDTLLMDACNGRVLCKIGAEGVHTLGLVNQGIGIAVKVEDGSARAQFPAVLALLSKFGELPTPLPLGLQEYINRPVRNTRGAQVGAIQMAVQ